MTVELKNIKISNQNHFVLIAGPCVVENRKMIFDTAEKIKEITSDLKIPFIFKASFKKANRTSVDSFHGLGDEALKILSDAKKEFDLSILTDIHSPEDIDQVKDFVDIIQIPAFLCRQTELLVAAGNSKKIVNIKKGQFLAPEDMKYVSGKIKATGNNKILLTERGASFGYHNLVVDMKGLVIMKDLGYPVVMDATHSVQIPSDGEKSGGNPKFILPLAKAAIAVGISTLFLEVHPDPSKALSDAASQLPLSQLKNLLIEVQKIDKAVKNY
ncbi:MAG: 3-deoxy-8-phosphooctulonate synthase [Ignavibacteriales bacterium CG12_big_fil_rev_8_21_14_0_65_30_8]|nr:MAG: 3-deoxy-8-phosphooctulonate synthase [Ignavibacteriales bacterium CG12_big_fil_rev_8_21_14_0_65_30_8]